MIDTTPADAEQYILSAMMQNPEAVWDVLEILPSLRMLMPRHDPIARAIHNLASRNAPTDPIAVSAELASTGELDRVGGAPYLHTLHGQASTWRNARFYAEIVAKESARIRMLEVAEQIKHLAGEPEFSAEASLHIARAALDSALDVDATTGDEDLDEAMAEMINGIGTAVPAYPTPWGELTQIMRGFAPSNMYVIGARPAIGKSAIALQIATELEKFGYVGYFSLEMTAVDNKRRQLSQMEGIDLGLVTGDKALSPALQQRAWQWQKSRTSRLLMEDHTPMTISDIRHQVRTWSRKFDLSAIVIDYLQLISPRDVSAPRVQQVGEISRELKLMAKEFRVPVIVLSQLNRASETRPDKVPLLADLRESGSIEQDADAVILVHRATINDENYDDPSMYLMVMKNRHGPTDKVKLTWEGVFVRAVDHYDY